MSHEIFDVRFFPWNYSIWGPNTGTKAFLYIIAKSWSYSRFSWSWVGTDYSGLWSRVVTDYSGLWSRVVTDYAGSWSSIVTDYSGSLSSVVTDYAGSPNYFFFNLCSHWLHGIIVHKFWYWYTIALGWCWWSINVFFALIIVLKPCRGFMCVFFYWLRWIVFPRSHWLHRICKK